MKRKILFILLFSTSCFKPQKEEGLVLVQIHDRHGMTETISDPERLINYDQIDFLVSQPYEKVIRVFRVDGANRSVLTTYHPNGSIWQLLEAREMRAQGAYREWFANGALKIEATVIGGIADLTMAAQESWLFDEVSTVRNDKGALMARMQYEKGELSGNCDFYYPASGALQKQIPYVGGQVHGEEREFWENGELKSKTLFSNGKKEGMSLGFWDDGSLCWEEMYREDLLEKGTYWNQNHEMAGQIINGFGTKALFENGSLVQSIEYRDGKVEGVVKNYDLYGRLRSFYHLKEGKKQGDEIEYYPPSALNETPLPKLFVSWDQDLIHGTIKTWYENGQMQSQRELCKNKLCGISCSWYRDGSLMLLEEYENNRLLRGQYYRKKMSNPVSSVVNGNGVATLYDGDGMFLQKVIYSNFRPVDPE